MDKTTGRQTTDAQKEKSMAKGDKAAAAAGDAPTTAAPAGGGILISLDALVELGKTIGELDTKIASASGSDTAAKKALVDSLVLENSERVQAGTDQIMTALTEVELPVLVGLVARLEERLKEELHPKVDAFVDEQYANTTTASKDEVAGLRESRKALVTKFKALREVLESFGQDTESVPDPKRSGGGRPAGSGGGGGSAKSGQNKENYRYFIDGKGRPPSQNSFSSLAYYATEGCPTPDGTKRWGASRLKEFLAENNVKFGEDDEWSVKLPNDKTIGARRMTEADKVEFKIEDAPDTTAETSATTSPSSGPAPVPEGSAPTTEAAATV